VAILEKEFLPLMDIKTRPSFPADKEAVAHGYAVIQKYLTFEEPLEILSSFKGVAFLVETPVKDVLKSLFGSSTSQIPIQTLDF